MTYYEVRTGNTKRFSSLSLKDCEEFARVCYRNEGEIPDIFEIQK